MSHTRTLPPLRDASALVDAMSKAARALALDLVERAKDARVEPSLQASWALEKKAGQTGEAYEIWRVAFCDQVAASWVLATVFVRTLEDRGFLPHRLAGPGADDQLASFRRQFRFLTERDYLHQIFDALAEPPPAWSRERPASAWVGAQVFGRHAAPLWRLSPSTKALATLLDTLRAKDGDELRFTFGRPEGVEHDGSTTRFLGDLYQDLNEAVRKRYALLQTPDFVENFILDETLTPAMAERGVAVTVCDPACGSGHFLLGAFDRLFEARRRQAPGENLATLARQALSQVYGVDLNPYAAAIARFRLVLSYLDKAGVASLEEFPPDLQVQVFVGDALLDGKDIQGELGETTGDALFGGAKIFSLLDPQTDALLRSTRFDVVVGNPPYITEKDQAKKEHTRRHYQSAYMQYALSAPFIERIFQLANEAGWTGQITANSFMKREFGKRLIEEVLPRLDLTKVIDTSGAYIPGHGTPTVLLFGRNQRPVADEAQIVRGTRGEPSTPDDPSVGQVWTSITAHHADESYEDPFISVGRVERRLLGQHPWSLGGGGAAELKELLESTAHQKLSDVVELIGFGAVTREDELFEIPQAGARRWRLADAYHRAYGKGDSLRDWAFAEETRIVFPYEIDGSTAPASSITGFHEVAWRLREQLWSRQGKGFKTKRDAGGEFYEYSMFYPARLLAPFRISFAFVATHNHFVLDRGGKVFNRSAPIIKLPAGATEEEHLALLGYLNSSVACFWMKQVFYPKATSVGDISIEKGKPENNRYEFAGTGMLPLPIPPLPAILTTLTRKLDALGQLRSELLDASSLLDGVTESADLNARISALESKEIGVQREMVALQEEIDWAVYEAFGLASGANVTSSPIPIDPEQRAFVSAVAQPERRKLIEESSDLRFIEDPVFKRLWLGQRGVFGSNTLTFRERVLAALRDFFLDAIERHLEAQRSDPRPLTARALAHALSTDAKLLAVAEVLHGSPTFDLETLLGELMTAESVPSATSQVYTDDGMDKRRLWEKCWDLQRREDAGEKLQIDVPPKYARTDYQNSNVVWRHRGKLDVAKERFIAYPTATPPAGAQGAAGRVFGWAGWTHLEQLQAVIALWQNEWTEHGASLLPRASRDQADEPRQQADAQARGKLLPLLQTMVDLLPWVRQWHNQDGETADQFEKYVGEECRKVELAVAEVRGWRAPVAERRGRGRPAKGATRAAAVVGEEDVLAAVRQALVEGKATIEVGEVAGVLGVAGARLKGVVDSLVGSGGLVEVKKRPRTVRLG